MLSQQSMEAPRQGRFFISMSRTIRAQMPGIAFHIVARTQFKEPWFKGGLESRVENILLEGVATSDAIRLSHCVMPNHFHLVLRQSSRPLGWIMQPIMRRIALAVQYTFGVEGHVFERSFRSTACETAGHLRHAIVYNQLNPTRAKICGNPEDYGWSSHVRYLTDDADGSCAIEVLHTLKLFGHAPNEGRHQLRANYLKYVQWRIEKDKHDDAGIPFDVPEPETAAGDQYFADNFCALPLQTRPPLRDLRDKALDLLEQIDASINIDELRRRHLSRRLSAVRDQLIAGLLQAGYRGKSIADYLRVSESKVSAIATKMRYGKPAA